MPVNENDFLDFAKSLTNDSEINCRNIVSRSYYSAYHACLITYKPDFNEDGGVHKKLIDSLSVSPNSKDRAISYILKQLRSLRVISDYHLAVSVSSKDSDMAINQTETLHKKLFGS